MPYELTTEKFQGPLEKLLELIEARELDITDLHLAEVTDDFLAYVKKVAKAAESSRLSSDESRESKEESATSLMRLLADFVTVASRLILLKSKALLPSLPVTDEEAADLKDLEMRLALFKRLKPAITALAAQWRKGDEAFGRAYLAHLAAGEGMFYPGRVDQKALCGAMAKLFTALEEFTRKEETISGTLVSLEEKMEEVLRRIGAVTELHFGRMHEGALREDVIVAFLAILHLARDHAIFIEQEHNFSDIIIRKPSPFGSAPKERGKPR